MIKQPSIAAPMVTQSMYANSKRASRLLLGSGRGVSGEDATLHVVDVEGLDGAVVAIEVRRPACIQQLLRVCEVPACMQ